MAQNNLKENVYDYLICCLILVLPFSLKLPNLFLIAASLFLIFDFKDYKSLRFSFLRVSPIVLLGVLLLYFLIKGLITTTISETKYSLLAPIIIVLILFTKIRDYKKVLLAIVIAGFLAITTAIIGLIKQYSIYGRLLPFEGEAVNEILNMERPYLGFLLVFSAIVSLWLSELIPKYKYLFFLYALYAGAAIFLISARISSITIIFLIGLYLVFYLRVTVKNKVLISIFSIALLSVVVLSNKSLQERLFILDNFEESFAKFNLYEPRVIIWPCAYEIASKEDFNPVIGIASEKELDLQLAECYNQKILNKHRANFFVTSALNTHNQFIGTYLTSGSIGLILLILFFGFQFYQNRKNFIKTALLFSLFLFFLVENVFYRQLGVYLFVLVITLINIYPTQKSLKKNFRELAGVDIK